METITVKRIFRKSGVKKNGQTWDLISILGTDKRFYNSFQMAKQLATLKEGNQLQIESKPGEKANNFDITALVGVIATKPDANPMNAGKAGKGEAALERANEPRLPIPLTSQEEDRMLMDSIKEVQEATGMGYNQSLDSELVALKFRAKLQRQYQQFEVEKMRFNSQMYAR